jgi:hypothetical protein
MGLESKDVALVCTVPCVYLIRTNCYVAYFTPIDSTYCNQMHEG